MLAVHEKSWTLIRDIWASSVYRSALPRVTGGLTRYLHGHTRDLMGVHDSTPWATTRNIMRIHTRYIGRPRYFVGTHHACLGAHEKLEPHAFCWATTWTLLGSHVLRRGCGCHARWHPCTYTTRIVGLHDCVWARVSAHLHGWARICTRTHECGYAYTLYGRTRVRNGNNPLPKG